MSSNCGTQFRQVRPVKLVNSCQVWGRICDDGGCRPVAVYSVAFNAMPETCLFLHHLGILLQECAVLSSTGSLSFSRSALVFLFPKHSGPGFLSYKAHNVVSSKSGCVGESVYTFTVTISVIMYVSLIQDTTFACTVHAKTRTSQRCAYPHRHHP